MSTAASATGYLELNIKGFETAISSAKKLLTGLAVTFAGFQTIQFFKNGIVGAIEFGKVMHQASMEMGKMDPGKILIGQKVLERMGLDAEGAREQMKQLVETGRPLSTMFRTAADYSSAMNRAKQDYGSQAGVLSRSAKDMNGAFYTIQSIGEKVKTMFMAATSGFIKPLRGLLEMLNKIDLASIGEAFGKKIGEAVTMLTGALKNGTLFEIVGKTLELGFKESVNWLADGLKSTALNTLTWFSEAFAKIGKYLWDIMQGVFSTDFFQTIMKRFTAMWDAIASKIAEAFGADSTANEYRESALENDRKANESMERILSKLPALLGLGGSSVFDTAGLRKDLAALTGSGTKTGMEYLESLYKKDEPAEGMRSALGAQGAFGGVADSLAKVGGGGQYSIAATSPEAKEQIKMNNQLKVMTEEQKETNRILRGEASKADSRNMRVNQAVNEKSLRGMSGLGGEFNQRGMTGLGKGMNMRGMSGMTKEKAGLMKRG